MPEIIHTDQTGCIEGRFIGQNIRLVQDITDRSESDEVILLLDQEKAFDRVEWDWLFRVLERFCFSNIFISWLKIMYKNMKSGILTNGYMSKYFNKTRGIRQGDAASGSRLNTKKTEGLIMREDLINQEYLDIKLSMGPVKMLGIPIGKRNDINEFWEIIIKKLEKSIIYGEIEIFH